MVQNHSRPQIGLDHVEAHAVEREAANVTGEQAYAGGVPTSKYSPATCGTGRCASSAVPPPP
jgi:hypothetical protein